MRDVCFCFRSADKEKRKYKEFLDAPFRIPCPPLLNPSYKNFFVLCFPFSIPEVHFDKSELQCIAAFYVSGFVRGSDDSLAADQFCVFVYDQIFCVNALSDYNAG